MGLEPGVEFQVLPETCQIAPAIEATASSLGQLHQLFQPELQSLSVSPRPRAKASASGEERERKAPRGEFGQREYHDARKQRWVTKIRVSKGKYRALTRKATPPEPLLPLAAPLAFEGSDKEQGNLSEAVLSRAGSRGEQPPSENGAPSPSPGSSDEEVELF